MGGILETFLILFTSNADEVEKGADKAGAATDKLEDKIKSTNVSADELGKKFLQTMKTAVAAFVAFQSVSAAMGSFREAVDYLDKLDETSEALGVSVEQLDLWGRAAKIAGGSVDGLIGSVKTLSAGMAQMDVTGKSKLKPFFDELGIQMTDAKGKARDAFAIFPEIADAFEKMDKQQAIGFGRKLGLDDGTIMLLQKGRREVDALIKRQKELGTINEKDAKIAAEYKDALDNLSFAWRAFSAELAGDVLPALTWVVEKFTSFAAWAHQHQGFLYGFFGGISVLLIGIAGYALVASGALAAAFAFLVSPLGIVIGLFLAASTAIGLLWDDFKKFKEDAPHLIPWEDILGGWVKLKNGIFEIWDEIVSHIKENIQSIANAINAVTSLFSFGDDAYREARANLSPALRRAKEQTALAGTTSLNGVTSSAIANSKNVNQTNSVEIGKVEVVTQATDADGIAKSVGGTLNQQMKQVVANNDDGVMY